MNNKKGFISMALVYSFFIIFLFIMFSIIRTYSNKNSFLEAIEQEIDKDINSAASSVSTLKNKLFEDNTAQESKMILENNGHGSGLFYTEDFNIIGAKNKRIYFFRGNVDNNNIIYGKENGKDICWKIVRTDINDNVRLVYAGNATSGNCNTPNATIKSSKYNDNNDIQAYVGYMYVNPIGTTQEDIFYKITNTTRREDIYNSTIKKELEYWYNTNTDLNSRTKIINDVFCNDKRVKSNVNGKITYGSVKYSLSCDNNDKLTQYGLNNTSYISLNGKVGLLTKGEVELAGSNNYLGTTKSWTLSPHTFDTTAKVNAYDNNGCNAENVTASLGVKPVIILNSNINVTSGTGYTNDPYVVESDL